MGRLTIYKDNYADATAVSNIFIDEYMKDANDAQLKIYLYLIRMMNANLSISVSDIADKFNHTEKDVLRALKYWEKNHLLALEYDDLKNLIGIHLLDLNRPKAAPENKPFAPVVTLVKPAATEIAAAKAVPLQTVAESAATETETLRTSSQPMASEVENPYEKPAYTADQLRAFKSNEETSQLIFVVEQYIGKQLSKTDMETIIFISTVLNFSVDLIDHLVQYCVERGKKSFNYIEKVALSWAEAGVTTPEQAEQHAYKYDKIVYDIMRALGKSSTPTSKEVQYINRWTKELGFEMDVIAVACERTVMSTDKHRFEYTDSILNSWYQANVHHASDIVKADENFKRSKITQSRTAAANKFNQFKQNSYDFDALEKELLSN